MWPASQNHIIHASGSQPRGTWWPMTKGHVWLHNLRVRRTAGIQWQDTKPAAKPPRVNGTASNNRELPGSKCECTKPEKSWITKKTEFIAISLKQHKSCFPYTHVINTAVQNAFLGRTGMLGRKRQFKKLTQSAVFFSRSSFLWQSISSKTTENSHYKLLFQFYQKKPLHQKPIENRTLHLTKLRKKIFQESTGTSLSELSKVLPPGLQSSFCPK